MSRLSSSGILNVICRCCRCKILDCSIYLAWEVFAYCLLQVWSSWSIFPQIKSFIMWVCCIRVSDILSVYNPVCNIIYGNKNRRHWFPRSRFLYGFIWWHFEHTCSSSDNKRRAASSDIMCEQWMINAQVLIQHFSALPEQQLAILQWRVYQRAFRHWNGSNCMMYLYYANFLLTSHRLARGSQ